VRWAVPGWQFKVVKGAKQTSYTSGCHHVSGMVEFKILADTLQGLLSSAAARKCVLSKHQVIN
jgi:hypothetical protein